MNRLIALRRARFATIALILFCIAVVGVGVWRARAFQKDRPAKDQSNAAKMKKFYAQLQDGLGKEVRFAKDKDSVQNINASVESVAGFIDERSGIKLSDETKKKLAAIEQQTSDGVTRRITSDELSDALTETAVERMANLTDQNIDHAADVLSAGDDTKPVKLRGDGRGYMKRSVFVSQAKILRDQARQNRYTLGEEMRPLVAAEINERVEVYSKAVPQHFGHAQTKGMTPAQAVLISYSVASDDYLHLSGKSMKGLLQREKQWMKEEGLAPVRSSGKAYGVYGNRVSMPLDLIFDDKTMGNLLSGIERRSVK